jgi:hypothetical protein
MMKLIRSIVTIAAAIALAPASLTAQEIVFESDLPRVMVFLQEDGATAATVVTSFLREAGFQVIDPTFAKTAAERDRARLALAGDDVEATALGRDLGAQVIILGAAPADAAPNPIDASLQVGTAQLSLRALRLDDPRVISTGTTSGRAVDATPQAARQNALRQATEALLYETAFLGDVATDWGANLWDDESYWTPTPAAAPPAATGAVASASASPGVAHGELTIAILASDAIPVDVEGTRGIVVVQNPTSVPSRVRVRGIVSNGAAHVTAAGAPAQVRGMTADESDRYKMPDSGAFFEATVSLPAGQDTFRVRAQTPSASAETLVRPVIGKRWAVIVGVSDYADGRIRPLRYADDDAQAFHDFLRSPAGGAVPAEQMRLLLNEDATADAIRDALFVFLQNAAEEDMVTVYVASHGAPDPSRPANLYILPYDTDADAVASTAFPMWDFKTAMRRQISAERVVVITDACHSGGTLVQEANPIGGSFADLFNPSRRVTISAAAANESSLEGPQWGDGHGVFTFTLLEGLQGAADADGDGVVTFLEAAEYVQGRVPEITDGSQNPQRAGLGDVPLGYLIEGDGE